MGLFGKIKEILFDEETVEIPVITKDEETKEETKPKAKEKKVKEREVSSRVKKNNDEVIIRRIDTPKKEKSSSDDLFDMPKFKEEVKEERKAASFSFPVFDDNDLVGEVREPKREKRSSKSIIDEPQEVIPKRTSVIEKKNEERSLGYNNAYDYSYGKYKGDYKTSRESNNTLLKKTLETKEEHASFTPSPIISPVYGVLNENYKKEDIVTKKDIRRDNGAALDLDSVRRKAYGTLEDDIENSLGGDAFYKEEVEEIVEDDYFDEEQGISIDDLLVSEDDDVLDEINDQTGEIELFNVSDKKTQEQPIEPQEEIDLNDEEIREEVREVEPKDDSIIVVEDEDVIKDKKVPKASSLKNQDLKEDVLEENKEEEDLFDLIDSLYDGKDEE